MTFRRWLHSQRPRHDSLMARAQSSVEWAAYLQRHDDPVKASIHLHLAARTVADCGCPEALWPKSVRSALEEAT